MNRSGRPPRPESRKRGIGTTRDEEVISDALFKRKERNRLTLGKGNLSKKPELKRNERRKQRPLNSTTALPVKRQEPKKYQPRSRPQQGGIISNVSTPSRRRQQPGPAPKGKSQIQDFPLPPFERSPSFMASPHPTRQSHGKNGNRNPSRPSPPSATRRRQNRTPGRSSIQEVRGIQDSNAANGNESEAMSQRMTERNGDAPTIKKTSKTKRELDASTLWEIAPICDALERGLTFDQPFRRRRIRSAQYYDKVGKNEFCSDGTFMHEKELPDFLMNLPHHKALPGWPRNSRYSIFSILADQLYEESLAKTDVDKVSVSDQGQRHIKSPPKSLKKQKEISFSDAGGPEIKGQPVEHSLSANYGKSNRKLQSNDDQATLEISSAPMMLERRRENIKCERLPKNKWVRKETLPNKCVKVLENENEDDISALTMSSKLQTRVEIRNKNAAKSISSRTRSDRSRIDCSQKSEMSPMQRVTLVDRLEKVANGTPETYFSPSVSSRNKVSAESAQNRMDSFACSQDKNSDENPKGEGTKSMNSGTVTSYETTTFDSSTPNLRRNESGSVIYSPYATDPIYACSETEDTFEESYISSDNGSAF